MDIIERLEREAQACEELAAREDKKQPKRLNIIHGMHMAARKLRDIAWDIEDLLAES